jgi:ABC-type sugar transport system ATPase subunit
MASIALLNVNKVHANGHVAARDLTLEIRDGELLVLVGPSGSGKSTILRLIAGLEAPTSGRLSIDGQDMTDVAPQDRDLAMVFQSYALYPHMTVRENLAFGLRVRRVPARHIDERVRATAAMLGIEPLLDRKPAQLSGGERQRVALGRAIAREARAFLLDEPLSNLDPLLRVGTRAELALLHRRLAATMVYVTHDQEEAMTLGSRIAVMRAGRIEQVGPPLDVFRQPANVFVARFVGSPAMNLWSCRCARDGSRARAVTPGFSLELNGLATLQDGTPVVVGVRPHDLEVSSPEEGDLRGRIEIVEPLGSAVLIHVRIDRLGTELTRVIVGADKAMKADEEIGLRVHADRIHLFDENENRIGSNDPEVTAATEPKEIAMSRRSFTSEQ